MSNQLQIKYRKTTASIISSQLHDTLAQVSPYRISE